MMGGRAGWGAKFEEQGLCEVREGGRTLPYSKSGSSQKAEGDGL